MGNTWSVWVRASPCPHGTRRWSHKAPQDGQVPWMLPLSHLPPPGNAALAAQTHLRCFSCPISFYLPATRLIPTYSLSLPCCLRACKAIKTLNQHRAIGAALKPGTQHCTAEPGMHPEAQSQSKQGRAQVCQHFLPENCLKTVRKDNM